MYSSLSFTDNALAGHCHFASAKKLSKTTAQGRLLLLHEDPGVYSLDDDLKLKEFSKSLIEKEYT